LSVSTPEELVCGGADAARLISAADMSILNLCEFL
jgi:hypothetical protein